MTVERTHRKINRRDLKKEIQHLLASKDFENSNKIILTFPPKTVINILFSFLLSTDPIVKWHTVTVFGMVVRNMAVNDMDSARVIIRRLMWQLNDESGGIGWGCPEAMAECLALHEGLAREFHMVLISYIREDGNFLEYEPLQEGAIWGVGRLSQVSPHLARSAIPHLLPFLESGSPSIRGLAVWSLGLLGASQSEVKISSLLQDHEELGIYRYQKYQIVSVSKLVKEALCLLKRR